jgi:septum formation protein
MKLILASRSPRRQQLLGLFGLDFETVEANIDESVVKSEAPGDMALRLAMTKARKVYALSGTGHRVLGGDTTVALQDTVFGKPANRSEAVSILRQLSGHTHSVFSGVALVDDTGARALLCESRVTFANLTNAQISRYCDTDDPYDKAGAYGIQGEAGKFVTHLEGSYSGVIGLPLWHTHQLLMGAM